MAEYITSDEMDAYVADRPEEAVWEALTGDEQTALLVYVSKLVDNLPFVGRRYDTDRETQPLQWPRSIKTRHGWRVADRDTDGNAIIPQQIRDAVCEEILARLDTRNEKRRSLQAGGVTEFWLGSDVRETFDKAMQGGGIKGTSLVSWTAFRFLEPYLSHGAR